MASRVIHYLIAEEIAKANKQLDRDRFVYGALLPDLSRHEDGSYGKAHFGDTLIGSELKGINWMNFKKKYVEKMKDDSLYLGYYCHLLMDALWVSKIVDKYIRIHPYPERKEYYQKSYEDYKRLNYLLTKEYHLQYQIPMIDKVGIDEVNVSLRDQFLEGLKEDIEKSLPAKKVELTLYPYEEITRYLNEAIQLCTDELKAFEDGKEFVNPWKYYVKC